MNKEIKYVSPFKKLCITVGNLPTAYIESMSYYEGLTFLVNYLSNNVIPALNNNGKVVNELKDFVENYFENLDVQEEINNKLDKMAQDGSLYNIIRQFTNPIINDFEDNVQNLLNLQNANINAIDTKINQVASGAPIPATSTDQMTDHNRIYVNTTDGYWYYYDGDSWEQGGIYQSTGINDNSILPSKTVFYEELQIIPDTDWVSGYVYFENDGHYGAYSNGSCCTKKIPCTGNEKIFIIDNTGITNIRISFWDNEDNYISSSPVRNDDGTIITTPENASYFRYSYYNGRTNVKPSGLNAYRLSTYYNNVNNKKAIIKEPYFNNISTEDILISNQIKIIDRIYNFRQNNSSLNYDIDNNKITVTATLTESTSTRYMGICFKLKNVKVGDVISFKSNLNKNATLYPWNITQYAPTTSTNFGAIDLTNSSADYVITQSLVDYINADENNAICMGFGVTSEESSLNFYVEITNPLGSSLFDYISKNISEETLNVIALGDSITALSGTRSWLTYFNHIQPINIIANTAVNGAWLMDKVGTIYDGNPVFNGPDNNINNVLGNQVQKILINNYSEPDIIMIAIGTNGGINCTEEEIYKSYYDSDGNLIPLENVDRKTSAGAFRYCNTTLREKYPNATIFWCSPIQGVNSIRNLNDIINYGKNLKSLCEFGSVQFVDTQDCGITGYTEINGSEGIYLVDGLHPNTKGAKYMGYYNATKVKEYTEACKLLSE